LIPSWGGEGIKEGRGSRTARGGRERRGRGIKGKMSAISSGPHRLLKAMSLTGLT